MRPPEPETLTPAASTNFSSLNAVAFLSASSLISARSASLSVPGRRRRWLFCRSLILGLVLSPPVPPIPPSPPFLPCPKIGTAAVPQLCSPPSSQSLDAKSYSSPGWKRFWIAQRTSIFSRVAPLTGLAR
ncbi:hypothetical protein HYFRA_00007542 [Hymenoscyphus fraxineus]|uniref:Uncharacterized protein n=1 Tax=Hymenoscyphus fraxineus TaxID=746836 RepID=A0A9N9KS03_9HELO|nr:hypothetical protein HYFRA_00007542 [Hymenoscyphus fraxineus]